MLLTMQYRTEPKGLSGELIPPRAASAASSRRSHGGSGVGDEGGRLLAGIKVLEVTNGVAGSWATATLAMLGAEVAAVRTTDALSEGNVPSFVDTTKRRVPILRRLLDLEKTVVSSPDPTSSWLHDALASVDIVVADIVDGTLPWFVDDRMGYLAETARIGRPVWVTISAFGLTGPSANYRSSDLTSLASGGLLYYTPDSTGRPMRPAGQQGLMSAGQVAALAALHGLDRYRGSHHPVHADISAQEAVALTGCLLEHAHSLFRCPGPASSARLKAPAGLFPCRNGVVRIAATEDHQWRSLIGALGSPSWADGLTTPALRLENSDLINREVSRWSSGLGKKACAAKLQARGVPATAVNGPREVLNSEQYAARGFFRQVQLGGSLATVPGRPFTFRRAEAEAPSTVGEGRLAGLRVAELTNVLAGPLAGSYLGAMGAEVTRYEMRQRLDIYRRQGPFADGIRGLNRSAYFMAANFSKQSVLVDQPPSGPLAPVIRAGIEGADVLLENLSTNFRSRLGVEALADEVPGLLEATVSGFGRRGPLAGYRAYGHNLHAYGGLIDLSCDLAEVPVDVGTPWADTLAGILVATIVAAWALGPERQQSAIADFSMAEMITARFTEYIAQASRGHIVVSHGNDRSPSAPQGVYAARGGSWLAVSIRSQREWEALYTLLSSPRELTHSHFNSPRARWKHRRELDAILERHFLLANADAWFHELQRVGIAAAPAWNTHDLLADPHLAERELFPAVEEWVDNGPGRRLGVPWTFFGEGRPPVGSSPVILDPGSDDDATDQASLAAFQATGA
jgi:crotonobetainyl-CoA:carnitine CoA-transferase CaiB-like acyl-CoA transferase